VTFPALYERTLEVVWKGSPELSWVDRFVVKSLGMTTKKTISKLHCNSEKTTRGERGS